MTTAERRASALAMWERRRAAGTAGWTSERRAKMQATLAKKFPHTDHTLAVRAALIGPEMAELRALITALTARVATLEAAPSGIRLVEWRPDHRRLTDGGQHVRPQRRANGLPKRPRAVA